MLCFAFNQFLIIKLISNQQWVITHLLKNVVSLLKWTHLLPISLSDFLGQSSHLGSDGDDEGDGDGDGDDDDGDGDGDGDGDDDDGGGGDDIKDPPHPALVPLLCCDGDDGDGDGDDGDDGDGDGDGDDGDADDGDDANDGDGDDSETPGCYLSRVSTTVRDLWRSWMHGRPLRYRSSAQQKHYILTTTVVTTHS